MNINALDAIGRFGRNDSRSLRRTFLVVISLAISGCFAGISGVSAGSILVEWSAVEHEALDGYRVVRGTTEGVVEATVDLPATTIEHGFTGLADCRQHWITVRSLSSDGEESQDSPNSVVGWPRPEPFGARRLIGSQGWWIERGETALIEITGLNFADDAVVVFADPNIQVVPDPNANTWCTKMIVLVTVGESASLGPADFHVLNPDGTTGTPPQSGRLKVTVQDYGSLDDDADGNANHSDNCVDTANADQSDVDADGVGDACDPDSGRLVAHWSMDAGDIYQQTLMDVAGLGHHGTIHGAVVVPGFIDGQALEFDASGDAFVQVPHDPELNPDHAFTIAAWVRPESLGEGYGAAILDGFVPAMPAGLAFQLSRGITGMRLYGVVHMTPLYSETNRVETDAWQHLAVTYRGGHVQFFADGVPVGERFGTHDPREIPADLFIGNDAMKTNPFHGRIDDLQLYNQAVPAEALSQMVEERVAPLCVDADEDGYLFPGHAGCHSQNPPDCGDGTDPDVNPGATEIPCDGIDQNCDGIGTELEESCGDDGLAAYWSMDAETIEDGMLMDQSGNGHHGAIHAGPATVPGRHGEALYFSSGFNQYVRVPDESELDLTSAFTVAAWINPETYGESFAGVIVDKLYLSSSSGYLLQLASNNSSVKALRFFGLSYQSPLDSDSGVVELDRWQHVAVVFENGLLTFYRDGQPVGSQSTAQAQVSSTSKALYIGNNSIKSRDFNGAIDELRIYSRAMTPGEIQLLAD
jgi:hypothetical protein